MDITKYKHACFIVTKDDQSLVVDPGNFSDDFTAPDHVAAVVITHEHADHLDQDHLAAIAAKNPDAVVYGPQTVTDQVTSLKTQTVAPGDTVQAGPFTLRFFGGGHAVIHESMPPMQNVGVMIDSRLYYPGDSLFVPDEAVEILAAPAAAPWMKIGEAIDFLQAVKPTFAFPTHDAILSGSGQAMTDRMLAGATEHAGGTYQRIDGTSHHVAAA